MWIQALAQPVHTDKSLQLKLASALTLSLLVQQHSSNTGDSRADNAAKPLLMHTANHSIPAALLEEHKKRKKKKKRLH